jgi:hypothetical protein
MEFSFLFLFPFLSVKAIGSYSKIGYQLTRREISYFRIPGKIAQDKNFV